MIDYRPAEQEGHGYTRMSYRLGIDVGSFSIAAAICRDGTGDGAQLEVVPLGSRSSVVRSVIYLAPDGQVIVGEAAERRAAADPGRAVGELTRGLGEKVPIEIGEVQYSAADLLAQVIMWVVDRVAQRESGPARGVTLAYPAGWDPDGIQAVADALGGAVRLADLRFCTRAQAAAASYSVRERIEAGATLAVYDLGGGSFETAVVRKTAGDTFAILGEPERTEGVGGAVFDDAVFSHVLAAVPELTDLALETDARLQRGFALCRRECTEAKEALSVQTEVTIPVLLPQLQTQVQLTRGEFEELIRPEVEQTIEALRRSLRSAALSPADLDAVVLVGGSSRVPLVRQLLRAELGCPIVQSDGSQTAIAIGAALSGLPAIARPGTTQPGAEAAAPVGVAAAGSETPDPADTELPPWLAATALDAAAPDGPGRSIGAPRLSRLAMLGLLGLVLAGGAVAVPFVMSSHREPAPAPAAGFPVPAVPARETPPPELPARESPAPEPPVTQSPTIQSPTIQTPTTPTVPSDLDPAPTTRPGGAVRSRAVTPHTAPSRVKPSPPASPPPPPMQVPDWVSSARS